MITRYCIVHVVVSVFFEKVDKHFVLAIGKLDQLVVPALLVLVVLVSKMVIVLVAELAAELVLSSHALVQVLNVPHQGVLLEKSGLRDAKLFYGLLPLDALISKLRPENGSVRLFLFLHDAAFEVGDNVDKDGVGRKIIKHLLCVGVVAQDFQLAFVVVDSLLQNRLGEDVINIGSHITHVVTAPPMVHRGDYVVPFAFQLYVTTLLCRFH